MLDKTFAVVIFVLMCVLCLAFASVLGILAFARRKGAVIPPRMTAFYTLAPIGALLIALVDYWRAFGSPPGHPALPDGVLLCSLCVYGVAFWIARRPLRQVMSRFMKANGGTAGAALANALLHPGLSLKRMGGQKPVADAEQPSA